MNLDCPTVWHIDDLKNHVNTISSSKDGKVWKPTRPTPYSAFRLLYRIKTAWMVFTGKVDVVVWEQ